MVNSAASSLVTSYSVYYEALKFHKFSPYIKLYERNMDDILLIWVKKKVQLSDFISHISDCTKLSWPLEVNQNNSIFF
jgi:hypothetical protein